MAFPAHLLEFGGQLGQAVANPAAVHLQAGLPRSPAADPTGKPRKRIIPGAQPRHHIFELGHLHLEFTLPAQGPAGEDIEDQLSAVDNPHLGMVGDRADLGGVEFLVEDQQIGVELQGLQHDLAQLAPAQNKPGVDLVPALDHGIEHDYPGRSGQLPQLIHRLLGLTAGGAGNTDQNGPIPLKIHLFGGPQAAELVLQTGNQLPQIIGEPGDLSRR